jgi:Ca2+-transporting ATPase
MANFGTYIGLMDIHGSFFLEKGEKLTEYLKSTTELLNHFGIDKEIGLTDSQIKEHAVRYGTNTLTRQKHESLLKRVWDSSTEPMILMLIMAALIALGVNTFLTVTGGEADFLECLGIFAAIFLSIIITVEMEGKSAKVFEALKK